MARLTQRMTAYPHPGHSLGVPEAFGLGCNYSTVITACQVPVR
jgi:hypothetical protein